MEEDGIDEDEQGEQHEVNQDPHPCGRVDDPPDDIFP
jgi:hypothetical protein